ncbi:metallophosphoesterase family protein [Bradyrhizobium commune]|uniref:Metallophosphoesterase n=1 Tax=Bradyrhizobium commune TaxID=83627 RepID=A0A7S9D3S6_9BRAD|nr:metallophosphoesterase [Bradyrhizobium commune]QPF90662.1 metallophosphoesterase [Bradyrhizobium commune]
MARIVVLSDIHLSPTHGFFWENWCVAREFADGANGDAVIVNGDLAINGPDSDAEIAFAATALAKLRTRVMALPGNHDVGDEPPGQDTEQIIDADRLARWDSSFVIDRWTLDAGGWRLLGVNAQLFGSGLVREHAQDQWLSEQLSAAGRPTALFLHKPLFLEHPTDDDVSPSCMVPSVRTRLLNKLNQSDVRLIVSGHLHQHRDRTVGDQRHLWVPAVAFAAPQAHGGDGRCGVTVLDFSQDDVQVTIERPSGLISHDLAAIKGHGRYRFLRDMPPSPPPHAG